MTSTERPGGSSVRGFAHRLRSRLRTDGTTRRLNRQGGRIGALERDMARVAPQVAALEARVEDLAEQGRRPEVSAGEYDQALSLVEEIRREHRRIRARLTAATRFEERLRQVEEQLARLTDERSQEAAAGYQAVQPPSTTTVDPVTKDDAGDAR